MPAGGWRRRLRCSRCPVHFPMVDQAPPVGSALDRAFTLHAASHLHPGVRFRAESNIEYLDRVVPYAGAWVVVAVTAMKAAAVLILVLAQGWPLWLALVGVAGGFLGTYALCWSVSRSNVRKSRPAPRQTRRSP